MKTNTKKMVITALFLALALILPFVTGRIPKIGKALLPMHIPVILCGFICGPKWGFLIGLTAPVMRSLLFSMPQIFPDAAIMTFELPIYGMMAGLIYAAFKKKTWSVYPSLIIAMLAGRLVWGVVRFAFLGLFETEFSLSLFWTVGFANALPGIILQLVLIPFVVIILKKARLTLE